MKHPRISVALLIVLALIGSLALRWHPRTKSTPPAPAPAAVAQAPKPAVAPTAQFAPAIPPAIVRTNPVRQSSSERFPILMAFSDWAKQFPTNGASLATGEQLARGRRAVMLHLIKTDPEQALAWAAPARWRTELPASITQHLEERVDARGSLNVAVATDFEKQSVKVTREVNLGDKQYAAYVYGRRLGQISQASTPIHGIALDGQLAVHVDAVRVLEPEEVAAAEKAGAIVSEGICGVSGRPANYRNQQITGDIGGQIVHFCGVDHCKLVNQQLAASGGGNNDTTPGSGGPGVIGWTQGPKNVLYMRVNFPDDLREPITEGSAYTVMNGVNSFYLSMSYDTTSMTPTVTPLLTLPQTKAWYATGGAGTLLADARAAALIAGYDTENFDLDIVTFTSVPGYDFGGLAYVGGKGVWLQSPGVGVTSHELGHNYGLWHANFWDTTATNGDSIIGPGAHVEYGNVFDTMGAASAGNNEFNAMHRNRLHWLPDWYVQNVISNGVYRVFAFDASNRVDGQFYAAKIHKDFQRDYWVEFRQLFKDNPWLQNGVLLNWSPWALSSGGTHLLDTTPGTPTGNDSRDDAAVVIGRTFTDAPAGVHITPVARGVVGTNLYFDVQVNLGAFPDNQPPRLKMEVETNTLPGDPIYFHAAASDPDGDTLAYAWMFDDLSFSTNNQPWIAQTFSPGYHVVRCQVSDMKGGVASVNTLVTVGAPQGYLVSGTVVDLNGDPVEGMLMAATLSNQNLYIGYTDSDGHYIIPVDSTSPYVINASEFGYVTTNQPYWTNLVTDTITNADFVATPLPTVSVAASTNVVAETGTGTNYFTVTRTGNLQTNLTATLFLSGTATFGLDYTLTPAQDGTNQIEFPPGVSQMQFTFRTFTDPSAVGPKTVTLTVLDDTNYPYADLTQGTNYVCGSLSEATITILDDDIAPKSTVTVTANTSSGDNSIFENYPHGGAFVFTRNGSTLNDLTVTYAVGGTATPGSDYQTLLGAVIIPAGSSSVSVPLNVIDDTLVESNETVTVTVSSNAAYTASTQAATITIVDDDLINVSIYPTANASEPTSPGRFTVVRRGDLAPNLVVRYGISGTASNGVDYQTLSGTVTIPGGQSSANISVTPITDSLLEGDESVVLTLLGNTNYSIGMHGTATVIIHDNQLPTVNVAASDPTASEPGLDTGEFTFTRGGTTGDLTVNFAISGTALNGVDYVPLDSFIVIPNGQSSATLTVIPFDDLQWESNETVIVTLVSSTNYNVGSLNSAVVTITDDDDANDVPAVGFTFASSSVVESLSPGVSVTLSATSMVAVTVDYQLIAGGTAPPSRYQFTPGTLTFAPGDQAKSIPLHIVNDSVVEPSQTIRLALIHPVNATLDAIKVHTYTILDDDASTVNVAATIPNASETGLVPGNFRFSRTGGTNTSVTVNFEVTGSASSPSDYLPIGNSVTIPVGAAFVDVPVIPIGDVATELPETVVVTLTSAPTANIGSSNQAVVTIGNSNTNPLPIVSITATNKPYAIEGSTNNGEFVFTRTGPATNALTVSFTIGGTANNGVDYVRLTNVVSIPAGQTSFSLPVVPIDDNFLEGTETVIITLTDNSSYQVLYPATATVLILDNEQDMKVEATDFAASKVGPDPGQFTFTRSGSTNADVTVPFVISGTASNGVDYAAITNFIVIPAGWFSNTLTITPLVDNVPKGPVTVTLTLLQSTNYTFNSPTTATVTIDDNMPMLGLVGTATNASENGEQPGIITITRRGDPQIDFTAHLLVGGTATYGVDYPPFPTNVLFCCGVMAINLYIYPTNDLLVEGTETVTVDLIPDPANYTIQGASNVLITIEDVNTNHFPVIDLIRPATNTVFLTMTGTNIGLLLEAVVTDDGVVNPTPTLTWTNISGPDGTNTVEFSDTNSANSAAIFHTNGVFVIQLIADDGQLRTRTNITVVVNSASALAPDLLYWPLDDGSGDIALDASGMGHNGILAATNDWITNGQIMGAVSLGGTNDFVGTPTGSTFLNGLKGLTVALWIKSPTTNSDLGFISGDDSGGTNQTLSFRAKTYDERSHGSNVIEAILPTREGATRYVSASYVTTNAWQHVALTWTNGSPPLMYINGKLDNPTFPPLEGDGFLTNCMQFIAGKDPLDGTNSWNGGVDDVRLYSRPLTAGEIMALAAMPPANLPPVINLVSNLTVQINLPVEIDGIVTDDGKPIPPGMVSNSWSIVTNAGVVNFTNVNSATNVFTFVDTGDYIIRLTADDGEFTVFADLPVTATEPTQLQISGNGDAAELGPVTNSFTLQRVGDLTIPLMVYMSIGGTASNGVDYVALTNVVTFPVGMDTIILPVVPFLDLKVEGDETVIITLVSNLAYTIQSSPATVIIHDSPYGQWSVANFTLEELTTPKLSGPTADFDHDGLINFAEYALNRNPKVVETNPPVATAIEIDPQDGKRHIMVTYQQRLPPTDVLYGLYFSTDMVNWNTGSNYITDLLVTDDGNGLTQTVKSEVMMPYTTSTNQFINLRIWQPTQ